MNSDDSEGLLAELERLRGLAGELQRDNERMKAEQARHRLLAEGIPGVIYQFAQDREGSFSFSYVNERVKDVFGLEVEEIMGDSSRAFALVDPEDLPDMIQSIRESAKSMGVWTREFRIRKPSGELCWIRGSSIPEKQAQGEIIWNGLLLDITERRMAEEELRESERRFKELADLLPLGVFELDRQLRFTFFNEVALGQFGYGREEALRGYSALDMIDPEDHEKIFHNIAMRERGIEPTDHEYTARRRDGSTFPASIYVSLIHRDGETVGFRGIIVDNTVRKRHENAMREIEGRYRTLVETSPDSIVLTDLEGDIQLANRKAAELHGFASEREMIGINTMELYSPGSSKRILGEMRKLARGGRLEGLEAEFLRRDGSTFMVELSITAMCDPEGRPYAFIGVARDIADRKRLEEEIQKRQKLDSLGVLAGGIAHDFNNILTAILGNISLARASLPAGGLAMERLSIAENACYQAKYLTMQLLTFSKGGAPVKRILSIAEILRDTVQFSLSGASVRPLFSLAEDLWPVEIDEGQIRQVIHNLIINADESMPEGGMIAITAENLHVEPGTGLPKQPGRYVKCSIRDQGAGIPAKYLKKVFDPYYTTKQKGSGLGLAVSYSIIQRHGGIVTAESSEGVGSVFSFYLPAAEGYAPDRQEAAAQAVRNSATGRVLVMDDEDLILNVLSHMLAFLGYRCDTARDGGEAIECYRRSMQEKDRYDAVIMDLTVPGGMGGRDAVRMLLDMDPQLKAIVSSGYSGDPVIADYRRHGFMGAIHKPYVIEELSEMLGRVIGRGD
ncbi:MAG: PAS domain S-box protein [Spirochaetes bacterium]|nr:PAS domain S-box protein [Spirochaetota bacterium]